jgi:hypothetical protein
MPARNPLLTLPPRRHPLAFSGALFLALGRGPYNDVKTATAQVDPKIEDMQSGRTTAASSLPAFWTTWRFRRSRGLTFARPNPKALQFHGGKFPRIGKWHVNCYEQLKHGRDVPLPGSTAMSRFARSFRSS